MTLRAGRDDWVFASIQGGCLQYQWNTRYGVPSLYRKLVYRYLPVVPISASRLVRKNHLFLPENEGQQRPPYTAQTREIWQGRTTHNSISRSLFTPSDGDEGWVMNHWIIHSHSVILGQVFLLTNGNNDQIFSIQWQDPFSLEVTPQQELARRSCEGML